MVSGDEGRPGARVISVLHPQGRIDVEVAIEGAGPEARIQRAALVRTARKILQGELHLPPYVFSNPSEGDKPMKRSNLDSQRRCAPVHPAGSERLRSGPSSLIAPAVAAVMAAAAPVAMAYPDKTITIVVPTAAGGGNDAMARTIAQKLGPMLGQTIIIDNRAGANGSIASEFVARAAPDGHTLMLGYIRHACHEPGAAEAAL